MNFNYPAGPKDHPFAEAKFSRGLPLRKDSTSEVAVVCRDSKFMSLMRHEPTRGNLHVRPIKSFDAQLVSQSQQFHLRTYFSFMQTYGLQFRF
jgi:hypothetical protein